MRRMLALALGLAVSAPRFAHAEDEAKALPRLLLDSGRLPVPEAEPDVYRLVIRGEYQLRYQAQSSFLLSPSVSAIAARPGLVEQSLGQNHVVSHWLRLTPRFQVRDQVEVVGQLDVVTGVVAGQLARDTHADATPRDAINGFSNVQPRWLYLDWRLPFGRVRVGQQPNHWGMGILANDGDHPTLFGDYRYGSISERVLFATKPLGQQSDFTVALAGDLVYRDNTARLTRGQQAFQGVLAAYYEKGPSRLGVFSTLRHQRNDKDSGSSALAYTDTLDALAIDVHGKLVGSVPGDPSTLLFGEAEAVYVLGSTNFLRTANQAASDSPTRVRQWGGAAVVGVVQQAQPDPSAAGPVYGKLVTQLEVGYASGDADPYDGTQKRFTFDPNHKVGLLMFDELLRWQTARASTAAQDPLLTNASRPTPGVDLLPSNGGVFGAHYINPTAIYRPRSWLDLKGGMVVAQSTSDVVDPYRLTTGGSYVNYRGGDARKKDLGVELDAGFEARIALRYDLKAQFGAQGGVLFPGGAFEDPSGHRMGTQWILVSRAGLLF